MTRRMSPTRRARVFQAAGGTCHICKGQIDGTLERWDVEHVIPYALTRDDSDENLRPAHVGCHKEKTAKEDAPTIAKAKRVHRKHTGAHRPKKKMPYRKFDGTIVWPE